MALRRILVGPSRSRLSVGMPPALSSCRIIVPSSAASVSSLEPTRTGAAAWARPGASAPAPNASRVRREMGGIGRDPPPEPRATAEQKPAGAARVGLQAGALELQDGAGTGLGARDQAGQVEILLRAV